MSDTTLLQTPVTLQASAACVPGTPLRSVRDMRTAHGGLLTVLMTNGATGPTVQCVATVHVAHNSGATPSAGAAGADWKVLAVLGGSGSTANAATPLYFQIPPCCHFQIEFAGNTVQNVTVEAQFTEYTKLVTT